MPLTHWFPSRGPKPISLVFRHSSCLNLHWPSKTFIHPPRMTMTDLATKRSICFPLSFSFLLLSHSLSLFSFSLCLLHFILLLFCWCAEYDEKVRVQIALTPWACQSNNAIPIWPWRTANSYVHLSIFLTHNFSFQRKPTDHSCKHRITILCLQVMILQASWSLTTGIYRQKISSKLHCK